MVVVVVGVSEQPVISELLVVLHSCVLRLGKVVHSTYISVTVLVWHELALSVLVADGQHP